MYYVLMVNLKKKIFVRIGIVLYDLLHDMWRLYLAFVNCSHHMDTMSET